MMIFCCSHAVAASLCKSEKRKRPIRLVRVTEFRSICSCRILKKGNAIASWQLPLLVRYLYRFIYAQRAYILIISFDASVICTRLKSVLFELVSYFPIFPIALDITKCFSRAREHPFSGWRRVLDPDMTQTHSHHILICISLSSLLLPHRHNSNSSSNKQLQPYRHSYTHRDILQNCLLLRHAIQWSAISVKSHWSVDSLAE